MKKLLLSCILSLSSVVSFAQSYMVMNNGKVITVDKQGTLQDLGNFILPYSIKEAGGRFLINKERQVVTVDQSGYFYKKEHQDKLPRHLDTIGENYFISKRGELFTVDESGFFYDLGKEKDYRKVVHRGGNFFITETKVKGKPVLALFLINSQGQVLKNQVPGLNLASVTQAGGRYFTTSHGELFTTSTDGYVYSKKGLSQFNGWGLVKGGNYFISKNILHTVSDSGVVTEVAPMENFGLPVQFGPNYFLTKSGALFTVSAGGTVQKAHLKESTSSISIVPHL